MLSKHTESVVNLMKKYGVLLSEQDINIFDDVFEEHKIRSIKLYTEEEYESFKEDLIIRNSIELNLNGSHKGLVQLTMTKVGDVEYGVDERQHIVDDAGNSYTIMDYQQRTDFDPYEMIITVLETKEWNTKGINSNLNVMNIYKDLYIYIPPIEEFNDNFDEDIREVAINDSTDIVPEVVEDVSIEEAVVSKTTHLDVDTIEPETIDVVPPVENIEPISTVSTTSNDDIMNLLKQQEQGGVDPEVVKEDTVEILEEVNETVEEEMVMNIKEDITPSKEPVVLYFQLEDHENEDIYVSAKRTYNTHHDVDSVTVFEGKTKSSMVKSIQTENSVNDKIEYTFDMDELIEVFKELSKAKAVRRKKELEKTKDLLNNEIPIEVVKKRAATRSRNNKDTSKVNVTSDAKVVFRQLLASKVIDHFMSNALRDSDFEEKTFKQIVFTPIDEWDFSDESWVELISKCKYMTQARQMIKDKKNKKMNGRRGRR